MGMIPLCIKRCICRDGDEITCVIICSRAVGFGVPTGKDKSCPSKIAGIIGYDHRTAFGIRRTRNCGDAASGCAVCVVSNLGRRAEEQLSVRVFAYEIGGIVAEEIVIGVGVAHCLGPILDEQSGFVHREADARCGSEIAYGKRF